MNFVTQLFSRRQIEKDLSEEIRTHLEEKVEELVEDGMPREEAVFAARREFGNVALIEQHSRETWAWPTLESIVADSRYGLRMLCKHKGFALAAVLTLALGIGANTAIFSVVNAVLLRPLPYPSADRVVYLSEWSQDVPDLSIALANFTDWQKMNAVFDSMVAYRLENMNLVGQGPPQRLAVRQITTGLFPTLGVEPILGRELTAEDDKPGAEPVVLLSDSMWARNFGRDPSVLGRRLSLDGELYTVIGVLPSSRFHPSWRRYDAFTSLGRLENELGGDKHRDEHPGIYAYARMKPGVTVAQARANMVEVAAQLGKQYKMNAGNSVTIKPLLDAVVEDVRPSLLMLMVAAGFVLLIACANVANLQTSRATERRREVALRTALGASGPRLARQFLCESILLALIGGALGLVVAYSTTGVLAKMAAATIPRIEDVSIDGSVLAFTFIVSVLTGIFFGVFPALTAYRSDPHDILKSTSVTTGVGLTHMKFRNFLAAAELAVSMVLLVGAGLTAKSLLHVIQADPGFETTNVLAGSFNLPDNEYQTDGQKRIFVQQLVEKASALPGVTMAGFKNPLLGGSQTGFLVEGRPKPEPGKAPATDFARVTPGAMEALGMRLLRGRFFTDSDNETSEEVVIVDDTLAQQIWPGEDPIGKHMSLMIGPAPHTDMARSGNPHDHNNLHDDAIRWMKVVGVVRTVKNYGVDQPSRFESYVPNAQFPGGGGNLVLRSTEDPEHLVPAMRRTMQSLNPNLPLYDIRTLQAVTEENVAPRRLAVFLLSLFSGVALVLAALGIYGVMAYVVTGRTHEIGVRMALGALPRDVNRLILGQGTRVALTGVIVGVITSLALTHLIRSLLFGVSATDPVVFAGVSAMLGAIAVLACYIPARAAMALNPVTALRYE
jgi:putative ABC transport system permease protein